MPDVVLPVLAIAVAMIIATLSLLPADARLMTLLPSGLRRVSHMSAYVVFAFVCVLALELAMTDPLPRAATGFLVASAFGMTMEYLQRYRPGRAPSQRDALVNAAGAALGALAALGLGLAGS